MSCALCALEWLSAAMSRVLIAISSPSGQSCEANLVAAEKAEQLGVVIERQLKIPRCLQRWAPCFRSLAS